MIWFRFNAPTMSKHRDDRHAHEISYEIICALERMPPNIGYFEFAA